MSQVGTAKRYLALKPKAQAYQRVKSMADSVLFLVTYSTKLSASCAGAKERYNM